jgi:excisionase family DNA binding protein
LKAELSFPPELIDMIADRVIEKLLPVLQGGGQGPQDKLLTVKELSDYTGLSRQWVYNNKRYLPHVNINRKPLFRRSEIDQWLKEYKQGSKANKQKPGFKQQAVTSVIG